MENPPYQYGPELRERSSGNAETFYCFVYSMFTDS